MSGEPKTLTLWEAQEHLWVEGYAILPSADSEYPYEVVELVDVRSVGRYHETWEQAASAALGVPVVARDERPKRLTHSVDIDLLGVTKLKRVTPEPTDQGVINGETTILRFRVQDGEPISIDTGRREVTVTVNPRAGAAYPGLGQDEALDLKAENERMRKALDAADSFISHEYHRNGHRLTDKEWAGEVLRQVEAITRRRLAGGENQK